MFDKRELLSTNSLLTSFQEHREQRYCFDCAGQEYKVELLDEFGHRDCNNDDAIAYPASTPPNQIILQTTATPINA